MNLRVALLLTLCLALASLGPGLLPATGAGTTPAGSEAGVGATAGFETGLACSEAEPEECCDPGDCTLCLCCGFLPRIAPPTGDRVSSLPAGPLAPEAEGTPLSSPPAGILHVPIARPA